MGKIFSKKKIEIRNVITTNDLQNSSHLNVRGENHN